jgi:hypothetical protein
VPSPALDYDCRDGKGNGPEYTRPVGVTGSDPYSQTTIIPPAKFNAVAAEIMQLLASAVTAYNQHKARRL